MLEVHFFNRAGVLLDVLDKFLDFGANIKFVGIGSAKIEVENEYLLGRTTNYSDVIKENNKVKIYKVDDGEGKLVFEGYIRGKEIDVMTTKIFMSDNKAILEDKILYGNLNHTGSIQSLLTNILNQVNAREDTGITVSCSITTSITKAYKDGETIYSIIDDIAGDKYERYIKDDVLYFEELLGKDLTVPYEEIFVNTDYLAFDGVNDYVQSDDIFYQASEYFAKSGNVTEADGAFWFLGDRNNTTATGTNANISFGTPGLSNLTDFEIQIDFTYDGDVLGTTNRYSGLVGDATDFSLGFFNADRKVRLISKPTYSIYIGPTLTLGQRYIYNVKYVALEGKAYLYQDGVLLNVGGTVMSPTFTINSFHIGDLGSEYGSPASNNKKVYDCKLWNRVLTDSERNYSVGGQTISEGLIRHINGKHFSDTNNVLNGPIDIVNINNRLLPCDNIVVAFDFKIKSDGTASAGSLGLFATPFLTCHVRETTNQVQFRYDNNGAVIAPATYLGNGDRERHRCVCVIFRYGNNTRYGCVIDNNTITFGENTKPPSTTGGKGIVSASRVYIGYGMGYGNVDIKNFEVYKFDVVDNNTYGIKQSDITRLQNRLSPVSTNSLKLFLSYGMTEGTGASLNDLSVNDRDATIVGTNRATTNYAPFVLKEIIEKDYLEYVRDYRNPLNKTINNVKLVTDVKELVNAAIAKSSGSRAEYLDATSITDFGRIERSFTNSGGVTQSAQDFVEAHKEQFREYVVTPMENDFFACDVGDQVKVFIDLKMDEMYYDGTMRVIEKTIQGGEIDKVNIVISKSKKTKSDLFAKIRESEQRIKKIEITSS